MWKLCVLEFAILSYSYQGNAATLKERDLFLPASQRKGGREGERKRMRERERKRKRKLTYFIYWFAPQIATVSSTGSV